MKKVSSGKISVIIPVHNAEKYIDKSVQSVMEQNYTNWELLLIENGSEDASLDICKKNAEKDSRIQVLKEKIKVPDLQEIPDYAVQKENILSLLMQMIICRTRVYFNDI